MLKKGDILELNQTINSNYAYLIFKGDLNIDISSEYKSSIISSSLGLNDGKKINDSEGSLGMLLSDKDLYLNVKVSHELAEVPNH